MNDHSRERYFIENNPAIAATIERWDAAHAAPAPGLREAVAKFLDNVSWRIWVAHKQELNELRKALEDSR